MILSKLHPTFVSSPICVSEELSVNQKGVNKKDVNKNNILITNNLLASYKAVSQRELTRK